MSGRSWKRAQRAKRPDTNGGSISLEELGLVISMENWLDVTTNLHVN
jgi:hypothetical protein